MRASDPEFARDTLIIPDDRNRRSSLMPAEPFTIAIPDADLEMMRTRIRNTRWAHDWANEDWHYGVEREWLRDLATYWANDFDWRATEAEMNRWPHFKVDIDGFPIHFIHAKGKGSNPMPLVLTHGWPWTFWDWKDVIGPLTDPAAHGRDAAYCYDVVVPSLPGFTFSTPLRRTGVNVRKVADLWTRLMRDVLGYDRFGAAGGDWGAMITAELGHAHPEHLIGVHIALPVLPGVRFDQFTPKDFAPDEQWMLQRMQQTQKLIISHLTVHQTEPQTLAYALADSPVGTAAWIWTRRRMWSDCNGDPISVFGRDFLCATASLYWLTNSIGSSLRIYMDHFGGDWPRLKQEGKIITVPTAFGIAPKELVMLPRRVAAENTDLRQWEIFPKGGHFGPAEQPAQVVDSVDRFFRSLKAA
jgi:pimeloyl-ACP methyl ester carboxylesterase